ncbi:MAG: preprotein translocase subunit YajC [Gemmatimonadota bacterium]
MMPFFSMMLQQAQRPSMLPFLLQFAAIIAIFWFLLIRPQRKLAQKHKETLASLKKGDEVMTSGGIVGTVVHLTEDRVTVRTDKETRIVVARAKIERVFTAEPPAGQAQ